MAAVSEAAAAFLYVAPDLSGAAPLVDPRLLGLEDRHIVELQIPGRLEPVDALLERSPGSGVVLGLETGLPSRKQLALVRSLAGSGRRVLLYWPAEGAVEVVDPERLRLTRFQAFIRRWLALAHAAREQLRLARRTFGIYRRAARRTFGDRGQGVSVERQLESAAQVVPWTLVNELSNAPRPVPLALAVRPTNETPLPGRGVYVRTDFWNAISSGGSYGHTCFVAHELARSTQEFVCLLPHRYQLLDELGVRQVQLEAHDTLWDEYNVLRATEPTRRQLLPLLRALKPAYVYERLCAGNVAVAAVCRELAIPHLVEYNGSEISMSQSFGGPVPRERALYVALEDAAFRNAALVSVVSERVREDLVARGVPASKVLVNPNGVDPARYRPLEPADRQELRRSLGFEPSHCVVGFTGTFGGWHGIDVLSAALPKICSQAPHVRFLLIGDGALRSLIVDAVTKHGLHDRVLMTGRVPQQRGARLLGACDLFVSPHSSHMVDRPFFGSPTKLFEYMAIGGGIVASDLEQIGEVLTPALRSAELEAARPEGAQRAVLCRPGDVDDFVRAVTGLVARPELARWLGANARHAAVHEYSWEAHVGRLWAALAAVPGAREGVRTEVEALPLVSAEDAYKRQTQEHWNAEGCGSQTAGAVEPLSLDWYRDIERYRYQEYAPWMPEVMEFAAHAGEDVLEVGGGLGTDLAQFASHGARVDGRGPLGGTPGARPAELRAAGLERPLRAPRRGDLAFRRRRVRSRLQQRCHPPLPQHGSAGRRDPARAPAGRPGDRDGLRAELHPLLAEALRRARAARRHAQPLLAGRDHVAARGARPRRHAATGQGLLAQADPRAVSGFRRRAGRAATADAGGAPARTALGRNRPAGARGRLEPDPQGAQAPLLTVGSSLVSRLTRLAGWQRRPPRPRRLDGTLAEALGGADSRQLLDWWSKRAPVLYPRPSDDALRLYREQEPNACELALRTGAELLQHRFDLLGSGLVTVADERRPARSGGYRPIDWHLDPRSGARFRDDVAPGEWGPAHVPAGSEVKWPWELGRCQHWPVLAQCYLLSGDRRFAEEIVAQLEDFAEGVPFARGVQWVCAMDVAIRAANWALAFEWIKGGVGTVEAPWPRALELLFAHGHFVADHLENFYEVTSNHYLSDLVGLLVVGRFFSGLRQGREWEAFARRELEKEIRVQVLPDGADYESSVPYHRLVAELLLSSARVMDLAGEPASRSFKATLTSMLAFQEAVLRPDGRLPVVGDADDGRLHVLEGYGGGAPNAGRHLLGPGAFVLGEPRFLASAGSEGRREAFWWGFREALGSRGSPAEPRTEWRLFPEAGLAVHRERGDFLLVSNGRVGTAGFGNHKHNDQLSFELHLAGQPLVVDPGSYVYTSDPAARNLFRGTGFHNTLSVDDGEQNELNPAWLFRLQERARPEHLGCELA